MIEARLFSLKDDDFKNFSSSLMPTVDKTKVIGVKTPALRLLAKELLSNNLADAFIHSLPHKYFEENQLHAFIIVEIKCFDKAVE